MRFILIFFFFSSRRRHTRWTGDWSSDVCSSDLYRGKKIFGGLPVTRGFDTPNSVIFRFDPMPQDLLQRVLKDSRITPGKRWFSFEVASTSDLRDALWWLNQAYERAR